MRTRNETSAVANLAPSRRSGFTLVELIVSITIIAILAGMLVLAVGAVQRRARGVECLNNLRQVALGFRDFAELRGGKFPTGVQPWYIEVGRSGELPPSIFRCPEDPNRSSIGYQWRDDSITVPAASLAGKKIDVVASSELLLVFDTDPGWHHPEQINAATVNAGARAYRIEDFEENLLWDVSTAELFFLP